MKNSKRKTRPRYNRTQIGRRSVQTGFVLLILFVAIRHTIIEETAIAASIDALCPLGGLEALWRVAVEGSYVPKTHASNLVLAAGLLIGTLLSGAAFCGWICPFGSLQDGLTWIRKRVGLRELQIPVRVDRWLRYGRFLVLGLILFKTISTVKLWFSSYDPYRTIFGLGWLFEFNLAEQWPAYLVALLVIAVSFWVPRAWCKYACPLGGALSLVGHISLLRIRRNAEQCKVCGLCEKPCPVNLPIAQVHSVVSTDCIGCLACVDACPRGGALQVTLAPAWWDTLRALPGGIRKRTGKPAPVSGD